MGKAAGMEQSFLAHRSGNIYGPRSLEDNWFEDRDQDVVGDVGGKLINRTTKRGLARRGFETHFLTAPRCFRRIDMLSMRRCTGDLVEPQFETTNRADYSKPVKHIPKTKHKIVRLDTFKHAKNPRPTEKPNDEISMWCTHPRHPDSHGRRCLETTTQSEYEKGLRPVEDPLLPPVAAALQCRGGHEKASTNYFVFPFGHAKNNFLSTPGARTTFLRESPLTGCASPDPKAEGEEPKRFARHYAFTGMARRSGARVFYDEKPENVAPSAEE